MVASAPMTTSTDAAAPQPSPTRRTPRRIRIGVAMLLVPMVWLAVRTYIEGQRTPDTLCGIARPGMQVDAVIAKATELSIGFLDVRKYHKRAGDTDGELIPLKPSTSTCVVEFANRVVVRVKDSPGPN